MFQGERDRLALFVITQELSFPHWVDCPSGSRVFSIGNSNTSYPPLGQEHISTVFHGLPTRSSLLPQFNLQIPLTKIHCGLFFLVPGPVSVFHPPIPLTFGPQHNLHCNRTWRIRKNLICIVADYLMYCHNMSLSSLLTELISKLVIFFSSSLILTCKPPLTST